MVVWLKPCESRSLPGANPKRLGPNGPGRLFLRARKTTRGPLAAVTCPSGRFCSRSCLRIRHPRRLGLNGLGLLFWPQRASTHWPLAVIRPNRLLAKRPPRIGCGAGAPALGGTASPRSAPIDARERPRFALLPIPDAKVLADRTFASCVNAISGRPARAGRVAFPMRSKKKSHLRFPLTLLRRILSILALLPFPLRPADRCR